MSEQVNANGPMYRPSRGDDQGIDSGTMRLLYLAGAGGLSILAAIAGYTLIGHSGGDVLPVVQADQRPLKVKPENPGGMVVAPDARMANPNDSRLAPGTEEPNPRALMAIPDPAKAAAAAPVAAPRSHPVIVQLSAAKSEEAARAEWEKLAKRMPELLGQHRALFQKTNEAGKAPWRLGTGGFADQAQAKSFCDKVKAKGAQCSLIES